MASGLYINLNDGYPMAITSGLRAPIFSKNVASSSDGKNIAVDGYQTGDTAIFIPTNCVSIYFYGTSLFPYTQRLVSVVQSGGVITMNSEGGVNNSDDSLQWPGQIWRITPANQSGNSGLLIQDTTDFTAITTNSNMGSCSWLGTVTISDSWDIPVDGMVFASWSDPSAVLERVGNTIYCSIDDNTYADQPAAVVARVAIFSNSPPVPGTGLNYFNAAGQCTFSTSAKPFVISQFFTPTLNWQAVSGMVPIGRYGWNTGAASNASSWNIGRGRGLMMSGGAVKGGMGRVITRNDRNGWNFDSSGMCSISLPVIPSFY